MDGGQDGVANGRSGDVVVPSDLGVGMEVEEGEFGVGRNEMGIAEEAVGVFGGGKFAGAMGAEAAVEAGEWCGGGFGRRGEHGGEGGGADEDGVVSGAGDQDGAADAAVGDDPAEGAVLSGAIIGGEGKLGNGGLEEGEGLDGGIFGGMGGGEDQTGAEAMTTEVKAQCGEVAGELLEEGGETFFADLVREDAQGIAGAEFEEPAGTVGKGTWMGAGRGG